MAAAIQTIGKALFYAGVAAFGGIFIVVLINGHWPLFLKPIQGLFAGLHDYVGGWAFIVEIWIFIGPGLALSKLGEALRHRD